MYNYAAKQLDEAVISILQNFSDEMELVSKFKLLAKGGMVNTGEKRLVLHHLLRERSAGRL